MGFQKYEVRDFSSNQFSVCSSLPKKFKMMTKNQDGGQKQYIIHTKKPYIAFGTPLEISKNSMKGLTIFIHFVLTFVSKLPPSSNPRIS